jgi:YNFM family putative membrane transporter
MADPGAGAAPRRAGGARAELAAAGAAGFTAFLGVYATQPLLPLLGEVFAAPKSAVVLTVTAPTVAVALASPLAGWLVHRAGHRRAVVLSLATLALPAALAAAAPSLAVLVGLRFLQGIVSACAYVALLALVSDAWRGRGVGRALSALVTGNVLGGFTGRLLAGAVAGPLGWRPAFLALAVATATTALVAWRGLPRADPSPTGTPAPGTRLEPGALQAMAAPGVVGAFAVGFAVLLSQVAVFTYVTFHLAAPPFGLGPAALGWLFTIYLVGAALTPVAGRLIDRHGPRRVLVATLALGMAGTAATLAPWLPAIVAGLAAVSTLTFVGSAATTTRLQQVARHDVHALASGLYVSLHYLGGSVGAFLPALLRGGGWASCVLLVLGVQAATVGVALALWRDPAPVPVDTAFQLRRS